ncbi:hypothetical protein EDC01DRAFT_64743 [Geopyxis carbonaria]|nr:hypothetical protein EDC01DRAFT_64743 [Geopyxis carbonaria]
MDPTVPGPYLRDHTQPELQKKHSLSDDDIDMSDDNVTPVKKLNTHIIFPQTPQTPAENMGSISPTTTATIGASQESQNVSIITSNDIASHYTKPGPKPFENNDGRVPMGTQAPPAVKRVVFAPGTAGGDEWEPMRYSDKRYTRYLNASPEDQARMVNPLWLLGSPTAAPKFMSVAPAVAQPAPLRNDNSDESLPIKPTRGIHIIGDDSILKNGPRFFTANDPPPPQNKLAHTCIEILEEQIVVLDETLKKKKNEIYVQRAQNIELRHLFEQAAAGKVDPEEVTEKVAKICKDYEGLEGLIEVEVEDEAMDEIEDDSE